MSKNKVFTLTIIVVSIISAIIGYFRRDPEHFLDTISYVAAAEVLKSGEIDAFRTPAYPLIIVAAKFLLPNAWETLIFIIQLIAFYFSVYIFSRLSYEYLKSETVAFITTLLYCAYPIFNAFNLIVATESFAISGCVFTLWIIFHLLKRPSLKYGLSSFILATFLIWLRPSLLVIPLSYICLGVILLFYRKYHKSSYILIASAICSIITYIPYSASIYEKVGVRTISTVSILNEYACSRMGGALYPEYFTESEIAKKIIDKNTLENGDSYCGGIYLEIDSLVAHIGWEGIDHYNKEFRKNQPIVCIQQAGNRLWESMSGYNYKKNAVFYLITLIFTLYVVTKPLRKSPQNPFDFMLIIFSGGVILTAVIGGQNEWGRLIFPMIPAAFIMLGRLLLQLQKFCVAKHCCRLGK